VAVRHYTNVHSHSRARFPAGQDKISAQKSKSFVLSHDFFVVSEAITS
jgi:hypothetical protein